MDSNGNGNSEPNGRTYVKFGPAETQELPIEWAERMLTELYRSHVNTFGKLLQSAAGVPARTR